jgi:hypothetical protein
VYEKMVRNYDTGWWFLHLPPPQTDTMHYLSFSDAREIILSGNAGLKSVQTELMLPKRGCSSGCISKSRHRNSLDKFGADEFEVGSSRRSSWEEKESFVQKRLKKMLRWR